MNYLKCRTQELEIPKDNPFQNDKLGRHQIANVLTDVVSFYGQSGCVMALNGEWGVGKTTFVQMWKQHLENLKFKTLYFNAWNSDYSDDALMAIVSELQELSPQNESSKKLVAAAARILLTLSKCIVKSFIGKDVNIDDILSDATDIGNEYLKEYAAQKETIEDFKQQLTRYVAFNAQEHPIVFFIDELDRCNPHYAVSVLERIKHLFEIPNIIFILAINKNQLCNAIQGYYSSSNMDSNEYLRRFIDIEYTLPFPKLEYYCNHLYNEYKFDDFFRNINRQNIVSYSESEQFKEFACAMCELIQANLRQIDRIYAYARLALMQFQPNTYFNPEIYFLLCFWKITASAFYNQIRNKEYSPQELLSKIEDMLPKRFYQKSIDINNERHILYTIAGLIYAYDITDVVNKRSKPSSIRIDSTNTDKCSITCKYLNDEIMEEALNFYFSSRSRSFSYGLSHIFDRIDLLNSFT